MANEETFFVQISNPLEVRKHVLVTSKHLLMNLKKYEELQDLRRQKVETSSMLKEKVKEVRVLMSQLLNFMPKTNIKPRVRKGVSGEARESKEVVREVGKIRKETTGELDKLERELLSIERKIGDL
ncbi:MAG: hypothetical protein QF632_00060 [Candidatus Woesearchaeota archaeon]|jgi:gamma-glutamylcyclotransferase (GGCT)/AIG2-like uncharacterized protein YtfP|nr:hypothetical protein [Candidatus Woesearchaeota archaeon]MDP7458082.1 hypothetical protein [Candidatus Woesearchaeota archaeon]|tara:strand:+ start:142 stop:519 length:378 start_codon:yes stop_codon:yes gene_type:complete